MKEDTLIYTVKQVAKILHTSPNVIYSLISCGKLKAFRLGSLKIIKSSLLEFLDENNGYDISDPMHIMPISEEIREES